MTATLTYETALEQAQASGKSVSQVQQESAIESLPDAESPQALRTVRKERLRLDQQRQELDDREAVAVELANQWHDLLTRKQTLANEIALAKQQSEGVSIDAANLESHLVQIAGNHWEPFATILNRTALLENCRATAKLLARCVEVKTVQLDKLNAEIGAFARKHDLCDSLEPPK